MYMHDGVVTQLLYTNHRKFLYIHVHVWKKLLRNLCIYMQYMELEILYGKTV